MKTLNDYKEEYNKLLRKKNLKGKDALEAVKEDGYALRYVKEQTEEICLEAVKQNGYALQYVKEQTEEICLEAVKQNGYALQFVSEDMFTKEENNELKKTLDMKQTRKKIEKLSGSFAFTDNDHNVQDKINEIIDHLNNQNK